MTQEYSFYVAGTHRTVTVTGDDLESARKDAAFLLNASIEETVYLPPLPLLPIPYEDEPIHTDEHPFCEDMSCPCHEEAQLTEEYLTEPLREGHITEDEAKRLYRGQQIR